MKKILLATVALAFAPMPILAETLMGCEIVQVDGGGYWNKVDPECVFTVDQSDHGDRLEFGKS